MTSIKDAALNTPRYDKLTGAIIFILCIVFPGITQMVIGALNGCDIGYIIVGLIQFLTTPIIVGFIWSIIWGWKAFSSADKNETAAANPADNAA